MNGPITYSQYQTPEDICAESSKILVFIDSCGYQKYFKTTVFSLTAMHADYAIMVANATNSTTGIEENKQHLSLCLAFKLPFIIVINKIDLCSPALLEQTLNSIKELISSFCMNKSWLVIEKEEDITLFCKSSHKHNIVPIFLLSCVSGVGINHLYSFLRMLKPSMTTVDREKLTKEKTIFQVISIILVIAYNIIKFTYVD